MRRLGELERTVMESLWSMVEATPGRTFTAREVLVTVPDHAYTTILTVLDRLTRKGLVQRIRDGRSHHYRPTGTRVSYVAELMHDALDGTPDRQAALVHFAQSVPPEEAELLRAALGEPADQGRLRRDRKGRPGRGGR
jgi:BlaI family transcriptional regulator, penicillinase repressor